MLPVGKKLDRIADALIKAGAPGKHTDYYRIFKENRIKGQEVKSLLFGRKITGTAMSAGKQFRLKELDKAHSHLMKPSKTLRCRRATETLPR